MPGYFACQLQWDRITLGSNGTTLTVTITYSLQFVMGFRDVTKVTIFENYPNTSVGPDLTISTLLLFVFPQAERPFWPTNSCPFLN